MISKHINTPAFLRKSSLFAGLAVISLLVLVNSCAVQSPISGGEKDIVPPKVVSSTPGNFSAGFSGERIVISFNEFSTLKDIEKQMLISPPVAREPDFKMKGKSLVITFKEPLQTNATYNIFMGNAIVDITEGNPLADYSFVFSTGSRIDSLGMEGSVLEAFEKIPPKGALAMLYDGDSDSLPYLSRPLYVARVNDSTGRFRFQNIREGNFKLIVLQDQDGNFMFSKGEAIAFADSLIPAHQVAAQKQDSLGKPVEMEEKLFRALELAVFKENDSVQRILRVAMVANNHVQMSFRFPVKSPELHRIVADSTDDWYVSETNVASDTLNFWLKNIKTDSLSFTVSEGNKILDTLNISLAFKGKDAQKAERDGIKPKLRIRTNVPRQGSFPLNTQLMLVSENPLKEADFSTFKLVEDSITLRPQVRFLDSLHRRIIIKNPLKEATQYQLIIPDSVFKDIYGLANDSVSVKFKTRNLSEYGSLTLKIHQGSPRPFIIQLLTDAGKVLKEDQVNADGKLLYLFLMPGKYKIKAILDRNRNGRWDTGNYLRHIQPEQIIVFPKPIELRSNWEQEEDWAL